MGKCEFDRFNISSLTEEGLLSAEGVLSMGRCGIEPKGIKSNLFVLVSLYYSLVHAWDQVHVHIQIPHNSSCPPHTVGRVIPQRWRDPCPLHLISAEAAGPGVR